jgi:hypothetical protein
VKQLVMMLAHSAVAERSEAAVQAASASGMPALRPRGGKGALGVELAVAFSSRAVLQAVAVELLIGYRKVAIEGGVGGLGEELTLELQVADGGAVLVKDVPVFKGSVGNGDGEFAGVGFGDDHAIGVVAAASLDLESGILNQGGQQRTSSPPDLGATAQGRVDGPARASGGFA